MGESVLGCGEVWEFREANTLFCTAHHILHTHPTPLLTLTQHLYPAPPHSPDTSLHTFSHSPPTSPHSLTLPHTLTPFPTPSPTLSHTHSPSSQPPRLLQHFPMLPTLYHYPMPEFLTFLIYCQISLTIKYKLLETLCKFRMKFLKQKLKMATQHLSFSFRSGH